MFNFSALQEVSNILQAAQEASENVLEEVSNTVEAAQTSSANVLQEVSDTLQEHQASRYPSRIAIIERKTRERRKFVTAVHLHSKDQTSRNENFW